MTCRIESFKSSIYFSSTSSLINYSFYMEFLLRFFNKVYPPYDFDLTFIGDVRLYGFIMDLI